MAMLERHELNPMVRLKKLTAREIDKISRSPLDPKEIKLVIEAREQADKRLKAKGISVIL